MPSSSGRTVLWFGFLASAAVAVGLFFIPAFIIRPFGYQAPASLSLAMALRDRAPLGTLVAALLCLVFAFLLWHRIGKWSKVALNAIIVLVTFSAVMARLNYFEWMFHPVDSAQFESESASKLASSEMILAVRFGDDARAYPISQMAYHHILNDEVGGVPIAVTY